MTTATTTATPPAYRLNALFNIIAGIGIFIQYLIGVPGYPKVPPGPIILVVAGILVLALASKTRWIILIGLIAPLFITVGGIGQGSSWARMGSLSNFGFFITTWIQWIFLVLTLVYGVIALLKVRRTNA
ncbi:MAG TPA: hypothetical protein VHX38_31315 [Pseudonocardiaceae bacterium]|jgi:hypothetical protein|nr:hypothetical protein [Pseudonocardiaceae bacterium]